MRKKVIGSILILVIIMIVFILFMININNNMVNDVEQIEDYSKIESTTRVYDRYSSSEIALRVAQKNGDWSDLPLTDVFFEKYNEKDGIFGKMTFDKVEYRPYKNGKYPFEEYSYLVVTQGKKKTAYIYWLESDFEDGYNDMIITNTYTLTDENGNEIDFREGITEKNFTSQMIDLASGHEAEQLVGVTNKFHSKYHFFIDIFEHYSPLRFNRIDFIEEKSSWENKEVYFEVDSVLECKKRNYLVEFMLDDKGYLDDVVVHKVNEIEYEGNNKNCTSKIKYKNSNWDNLELTENFRKKFRAEIGIIPEIDNINIDIPIDSVSVNGDIEYICCFSDKNNNKISYFVRYIDSNDNYLDDVICEKLPYINKTIGEVKELYLKDYAK